MSDDRDPHGPSSAAAGHPDRTTAGAPTPGDPSSGGWSWSEQEGRAEAWTGPIREDRYRRGVTLAQSAMSTVRLADDPLLRRTVIVKTVPGEPDTPAARRLLREARITAALAGHGVVPVLDAGADAEGHAWFAMPVLDGEGLDALLRAGTPTATLLGHLVEAARVLARAHDLGIVHRDIKLDNLIVSRPGAGGAQVHVMDWGIARPEAARSGWDAVLSSAEQTARGQLVGTPANMSPEQVIGGSLDRRSDVWALGVCLAELATGAGPFQRGAPAETLRAVVQGPLPSLPGPLGTVLDRCLQRDPHRRLADARAFADALAAALAPTAPTGGPPATRPPRPRAWRTLLVPALAALVGGMLGTTLRPTPGPPPAATASTAPDLGRAAVRLRALDAARRGDIATAELLAATALLDGEDPFLRGVLASTSERPVVVDRRPIGPCADALVSADGRSIVCQRLDETLVIDVQTATVRWRKPLSFGSLGIAGDRLVGWVAEQHEAHAFDLETGAPIPVAATAAAGRRMGVGRSPRRFSVISREVVEVITLEGDWQRFGGEAFAAVVLPDDRVAAVGRDRLYLLDDALQPTMPPLARPTLSDADSPWSIAASADGRIVVEGSLAGQVRVWDIEAGEATRVSLREGMVRHVALSPDGRWVAAVDEAGRPWLWERGLPTGRLLLPGTTDRVAFPDARTLALVGEDRVLWRLPEAADPGLWSLPAGVSSVDWHGDWVAAALGDGSVHRWHLPSGRHDTVQLVVENVAKDVSIGPGGAVLAASILTAQPSRWLWTDGHDRPYAAACRRVAWLEGGVGVCQEQRPGPRVEALDGRTWPTLGRSDGVLLDTEPIAGRTAAVMIDEFGVTYRLDATTDPTLVRLAETGEPGPVAMSHRPDAPVYVGRSDAVEAWPTAGGPPERIDCPGRVVDLAVSPDGAWLAAGLSAGDVAVWSTADHRLRLVLPGHSERVSSVGFADDSQWLISGSWDETLRTWSLGGLDLPAAGLVADAEARWGVTARDLLHP